MYIIRSIKQFYCLIYLFKLMFLASTQNVFYYLLNRARFKNCIYILNSLTVNLFSISVGTGIDCVHYYESSVVPGKFVVGPAVVFALADQSRNDGVLPDELPIQVVVERLPVHAEQDSCCVQFSDKLCICVINIGSL